MWSNQWITKIFWNWGVSKHFKSSFFFFFSIVNTHTYEGDAYWCDWINELPKSFEVKVYLNISSHLFFFSLLLTHILQWVLNWWPHYLPKLVRGSVILVKAPWPFQVIDLYDYAKEETYKKVFGCDMWLCYLCIISKWLCFGWSIIERACFALETTFKPVNLIQKLLFIFHFLALFYSPQVCVFLFFISLLVL